jgi:hypothetical protein
MNRIISFHRKPQRHLARAIVIYELLRFICLVVIIVVGMAVAGAWYGSGV